MFHISWMSILVIIFLQAVRASEANEKRRKEGLAKEDQNKKNGGAA